MNLRKGLIAAATALTVSAAGVGVASAEDGGATDTSSITALSSGSSSPADKEEKAGEDDPKLSSLSSSNENKDGEGNTELSSQDGLEELNTVLKLVSTAVGAVATIYGALTALDIL